jgi:REP element-mobilizing transposase RayT
MPRPPRVQVPGGLYHLGLRGVRRSRIFRSEGDYDLFEALFERVVERFDWRCHTYCLMPNHYHLVVETPAPNLSAGMQRLNSVYAQWFNELHGFSGHVFERRFFSRLVESTYDLLELVRYVILNPVRAEICAEAGEWRRSSYLALAGAVEPEPFLTTDFVLGHFGSDPARAQEAFRRFIAEAPLHYRSRAAAREATSGV